MGQGVTCYPCSFPFLFLFDQPRLFSPLSLHARVNRARTVESANQFMRQTDLCAFVEKDTREGIAKKARFQLDCETSSNCGNNPFQSQCGSCIMETATRWTVLQ